MHRLLVLATVAGLAGLAASADADVIRCADSAGKVSYTDGACPAGTRLVGQVQIMQPATLTDEEIAQREEAAQEAAQRAKAERLRPKHDAVATLAHPAPSGPSVIDPRAGANVGSNDRMVAGDISSGATYDYGDGYGYPVGAYRQPPTNLAPRIRKCDAKGCQDNMGNRYDHSGQVSSYRSLGGQTCRPVGTTVICK